MKFKILFTNHEQTVLLEDFMYLPRLLIESIGYIVEYDYTIHRGGNCNILIEHFNNEDTETIARECAAGADVIIVATEYVTGDTFNNIPGVAQAEHYADAAYWKLRYQNFLKCAEGARAVWLAMDFPEQLTAYRAVIPSHVAVLPLPFPFIRSFARAPAGAGKDIDVFFTGTGSQHRNRILDAIDPRLRMVRSTAPMPDYLRRDFSTRSKICLNLRQTEAWPYPSQMRYWYHLNHGNLVVGESCPRQCRLDRYVVPAATHVLPDLVADLARSGRWRGLTADLVDRYADEFPCGPAARELLEQSFVSRSRD